MMKDLVELEVTEKVEKIMELVDDYADALHAALRPDGGIQFGEGLVAKTKKDRVREALRALVEDKK